MVNPVFGMWIPLGGDSNMPGFGGGVPGQPGHVSPPIFHPGHPDHGLPSVPGHPSGGFPVGPGHVAPPIFHPGHPDHGLPSVPGHPSAGLPVGPGHPGNALPINPAHPDNSLPTGGTPVTVNPPLPPPGGALGQQIVVAIYVPGKGWTAKSYPYKPEPPSGTAPA
jgi:hypothetical protein